MIQVGEYLGRGKYKKKILEIISLSNGWILVKTENSKSTKDFKVRTITDANSGKFYTPKHAHFVIDLFGKLCQNKEKAKKIFDAIIEMWQGKDVKNILRKYENHTKGLVGYDLEYILYALKWILEQEDINFNGRPTKLQEKLNEKFNTMNIKIPPQREGSQLAISLFCDILLGIHPVEALLAANLDIIPKFKKYI
jgi:hypothetical protein